MSRTRNFLSKFRRFFLFFLVFPRLFLVVASISMAKNKKIQALVKIYVVLTQSIECICPICWPLGEGFGNFCPQFRIQHAKILPWDTSWAHMAWLRRFYEDENDVLEFSKCSSLNKLCFFSEVFGGPGEVKKVREASRKQIHLVSCKVDLMVPNYDEKDKS